MKWTKLFALLMVALAVFAWGCSSDDDPEAEGRLKVDLDTQINLSKAADDADVMATFQTLRIYDNRPNGSAVTLFATATELNLSDFEGGALLGNYDIPTGSYNCMSWNITAASVVEGANTCTTSPSITGSFDLCLTGGSIITIEEDESRTIEMQFPVVTSTGCPVDGGTASLVVGDPGVYLPSS